MKIGILGMGYVGSASAACLLKDGHEIVAVDPIVEKIEKLSKGESPMIYEDGIKELLFNGYLSGKLHATTDPKEDIYDCDMLWVCVGTPNEWGEIDLQYVFKVIHQIGQSLREKTDRPLIVIRSTCLPGTTKMRIIPLFQTISNLVVGKDIDIVYHPEFLREGRAIEDFVNPSRIVVGEEREGAADKLMEIYRKYSAPRFRLKTKEAEMVKYCDNIFHALKITFANEISMISKKINVDPRKIADVYCADKKLNISTAYMRPGFAYGGSCLPKDIQAMMSYCDRHDVELPMCEGIIKSNKIQITNLVSRILQYKPKTVGIIGVSFKPNTDDVRESPYLKVAKELVDLKIELKIYDKIVKSSLLHGTNKKYFRKFFDKDSDFFVSSFKDMSLVDLIIINHPLEQKEEINKWIESGIQIIDLVGVEGANISSEKYEGIYW